MKEGPTKTGSIEPAEITLSGFEKLVESKAKLEQEYKQLNIIKGEIQKSLILEQSKVKKLEEQITEYKKIKSRKKIRKKQKK